MDRFLAQEGVPKGAPFSGTILVRFFAPKGCLRGSFLGTFWGAFSVRFFGGCLAPEGATAVKGGVGIRAQEGVGGGINSSP